MFRFGLVLLIAAACVATAAAEEKAAEEKGSEKNAVSFYRDVMPVLREHCQGCHQPAKRGGELLLTTFDGLMAGGESEEKSVVVGKPDASHLIEQILPAKDGKASMPKGKPAMTKAEIDVIRKWIASGAANDTPMNVRVVYSAKNPPRYQSTAVVTSLDFSPDGKVLAVSGYHEALLHKADGSGRIARLIGLSERIESVRFSPDGKRLAVVGGSPGRLGEVQVWDVAKRKLNMSVTKTYDTLYGASWSPDGKLIAYGAGDNVVCAVESTSGKQLLRMGSHSDWVLDTVFSAKGTHLVSVSRDMTMKLTVVATQRFEDNITSITPGALKGGLAAVDRHPTKDEMLSGGADGVPKIYRMIRNKARKIGDDYNLIRKFKKVPGRIYDARYSADGNRIVVGSSHDRTGQVNVFDANNAKLVATMQGQKGGVFAVAFRPDGKVVASAGFDGVVRLNDAATGKLISEFVPAPLEASAAASAAK